MGLDLGPDAKSVWHPRLDGRKWEGDVIDDEAEDDDLTTAEPPQRRTDDTEELAFYHALPSKLWEEVRHDFQLGAILDIAAGDGSLALTAVRV